MANRRPGEEPSPGEWPEAGPEAAALAAGAGGKTKHERVCTNVFFISKMINGYCDSDRI